MLYQMKAWNSISGWHCGCVDKLGQNSNAWWYPARILGISPAEFISLLLEEYKPDRISYNLDKNVLLYSFKSEIAMKKYMNFINKKAREVNFQV